MLLVNAYNDHTAIILSLVVVGFAYFATLNIRAYKSKSGLAEEKQNLRSKQLITNWWYNWPYDKERTDLKAERLTMWT